MAKKQTYKRIGDEVLLSDFINLADSNFQGWLDTRALNKKQKEAVTQQYSRIMKEIAKDPSSFVMEAGNSFNNNFGVTNATEGFDAAGAAVGYIGEMLRKVKAYTPENLYKKGDNMFTQAMQSRLIGNDPNAFLALDAADENGHRSTKNRDTKLITGLTDIYNNIDQYRDFDDEETKQDFLNKLQQTIKELQDGDPSNDWFALERLGLQGIKKFYSTQDEIEEPEPVTVPTESSEGSDDSTSDSISNDLGTLFSQFVNTRYPVGRTAPDYNLGKNNYNTQFKIDDLDMRLGAVSNDILTKFFKDYIVHRDNFNVKTSLGIRSIYRNAASVQDYPTELYLNRLLNAMYRKNMLIKLGENRYLVPGTWRKDNTVYVWDTNGGGLGTLQNVSIHKIPQYRKIVEDEFFKEHPELASKRTDSSVAEDYPDMFVTSQKKGGVLKGKTGLDTELIKAVDPIIDRTTSTLKMPNGVDSLAPRRFAELNYGLDTGNSDPNVGKVDYSYNTFILPGWSSKNRHDNRTSSIGKDPSRPNIIGSWSSQNNYAKSGNIKKDVLAYQSANPNLTAQQFIDLYNSNVDTLRATSNTFKDKGYNATGFKSHYNLFNQMYGSRASEYNQNVGAMGSQDNISDILGSTMWLRTPLAFNSDSDYQDQRVFQLNDGTKVRVNNDGKLEIYDPVSDSIDNEGKKIKEQAEQRKNVYGKDTKEQEEPTWQDKVRNLIPQLLRSNRLADALRTNNRIRDIVMPSLQPALLEPYDLHSPVTGDYYSLKTANNMAADIRREGQRTVSSDASLNTARALQGESQASDQEIKGQQVDNAAIDKSLTESQAREEKSREIRNKVANTNTASVIQTNQQRAQLDANLEKQNWEARDKFFQELENNINKSNLDRRDINLQSAQQLALSDYEEETYRLNAGYYAWKAQPGNETKTPQDYDAYTGGQYMTDLRDAQKKYKQAVLQAYVDQVNSTLI